MVGDKATEALKLLAPLALTSPAATIFAAEICLKVLFFFLTSIAWQGMFRLAGNVSGLSSRFPSSRRFSF